MHRLTTSTDKTAPRAVGPYIVKEKTDEGNYILQAEDSTIEASTDFLHRAQLQDGEGPANQKFEEELESSDTEPQDLAATDESEKLRASVSGSDDLDQSVQRILEDASVGRMDDDLDERQRRAPRRYARMKHKFKL